MLFSYGCGTTWHAAGLIGSHRFNSADVKYVKYSAKLYEEWENEGIGTGIKKIDND